jgi:hypothetical protein
VIRTREAESLDMVGGLYVVVVTDGERKRGNEKVGGRS